MFRSLFSFALFFITILSPLFCAEEFSSLREVMNSQFALDFALQGEYQVPERDWFLQIVADGNLHFRLVIYTGGFPGEGRKVSVKPFFGTGNFVDGVLEFALYETEEIPKYEGPKNWDADIRNRDDSFLVRIVFEGNQRFLLDERTGEKSVIKKIERVSPTLGAKPPKDAIVFFDGTQNNLLLSPVSFNEEYKTLLPEFITVPLEKDRPYHLHLEFQTSFMPDSFTQYRANSGVFLAQMYECQVLDSFGTEGISDDCGGIYLLSDPKVNRSFPPLSWQTYDIDFTPARFHDQTKIANARITVYHNGVVVQDDYELPCPTQPIPEQDESLGVLFQNHRCHIQYRNIWAQYQ